MPAIDVHAHAMPLPHLQWLAERGLADLTAAGIGPATANGGIVRLDPRVSGVGPGAPLPLARSQWDVGARLAEMDAAGVSHHAVSLPPFLFCSTADEADLATEVVCRGNDALAEYVGQAPDRLVALGSVPLGVPGVEVEAARCLDAGMSGVVIGTRGAGRELDDPVNEALWALLGERRAFVLLHPSGVPDLARLSDHYLAQLVGYPMETAIAVARLVFSGVRERHPFPLCLAHGGGCLPSLRGRLDLGWERKEVAHTTPQRPSAYVRDLYFDTAVFSAEVLRHLVDDFGADRVLLGTDFPFELADRDPLGSIDAIDCTPEDVQSMTWHTAAGLLGMSPDAGEAA